MAYPNPSFAGSADFERCSVIAYARPSTLVKEAEALDRLKHHIFVPCYATMRIIDDLVDITSEGMTAAQKRKRVDQWAERAIDASDHRFVACNLDPDDSVFRALADVLPHFPIGPKPWHALTAAMQRDLDQEPMIAWQDFEDYCEGATVAPTYIYLMLLLAEVDNDHLVIDLAQNEVWQHARTLGTFCYLVHIIRDHKKDAREGSHLLTVPRTAYADGFDDLDALAAAWSGDPGEGGRRVLQALADRATALGPNAASAAIELARTMAATERSILERVLTHYQSLFEALKREHRLI